MEYDSVVALGARTRALQSELKRNISDLKDELKESGYGKTRNLSSVPSPQDPEDAELERVEGIKRVLDVPDVRPIISHDKILELELHTCDKLEHTADSLPLILHQFFLSRCEDLLLLKQMHLMRWSRFCRHGGVLNELQEVFQNRVHEIMLQYKDFWHRARRLETAHKAFLGGRAPPIHDVTNEDMCLYLNWLCWKFDTSHRINTFLMVLSHIPSLHKSRITPPADLKRDYTAEDWEQWLSSCSEDRYLAGWRKNDKLNKMAETSQSRLNDRQTHRLNKTQIIEHKISNDARHSRASITWKKRWKQMISSRPMLLEKVNRREMIRNRCQKNHISLEVVSAAAGFEAGREDYGLPVGSPRIETFKHRLQSLLDAYAIAIDLECLSPADELELYYQAHRRLKNLLSKQTEMMTFPVFGSIPEDDLDPTLVTNTFLKASKWEPHRLIYPALDATRQTVMSQIRQRNTVDELLKNAAAFLHIDSLSEVAKSLKNYVSNLRETPAPLRPHSVASHPAGKDTQPMWRRVYLGDGQNDEEDKESVSDVNCEDDGVLGALSGRGPQSNGVYGTFTFTPGNLGFGHSGKTSSGKDAHMAYLMLRHLKLRHMRRSCLGILNYFKSIERTINLDLAGNCEKRKEGDAHITRNDSAFLHNSRIEHIQKMYEYLESGDIENLDDFYTEDEGITHVQDSNGYFVMYESALDSVSELEEELLLVCSHFISKDKVSRLRDDEAQNTLPKNTNFSTTKLVKQPSLVVDLVAYSHVQIDRAAVLLDIWSHEIAFQKNKKRLVDSYIEMYHHVWCMEEKRRIAQVIISLMYRRPRYDVDAPYFIRTYINECQILAQWASLVHEVANSTIKRERDFCSHIAYDELNGLTGGLPFKLIEKQPISVTNNVTTLQTSYFLEFSTGLAKLADIPQAIDQALQELKFAHQPKTVGQVLSLHRQLLEACKVEWVKLDTWGGTYSTETHANILSTHITSSPSHLHVIASQHEKNLIAQLSTQSRHPSRAAVHTQRVSAWSNVMEMILLKQRLHHTVLETDLLMKLYKSQSKDLGFEQHHCHLRPVAFESGSASDNKTSFGNDDDVALDRFVPSTNVLAIQDLDEKDIGHIKFNTKDSIIKMLILHGLKNVQLALKAQLVQRNNLVIAQGHNNMCFNLNTIEKTKSRPSSASKPVFRPGDFFLSLQLAQSSIRDNMVKDFVRQAVKIGREREKVVALKQQSINKYCSQQHNTMSIHILRTQIHRYVKSLTVALDSFPDIRDAHFKIGMLDQELGPEDDTPFLPVNKNYFQTRPRRLLSPDGKKVINVFYIPHQVEILNMFCDLDLEKKRDALMTVLNIMSGIHDICMYMIAYVKMGASKAKLGSSLPNNVSVGADWGGPEAIAYELTEVQLQLSNLANPTSAEEVVTFLEYKKKVFFLEFYLTVCHCVPETFLAKGNERAFYTVLSSVEQSVSDVSDVPKRCLTSLVSQSQTLFPHQYEDLMPYRAFTSTCGPFSTQMWQCERISPLLTLGLSQLSEFNKDVANGEVVGVSLLLEDVLQQGRCVQDKTLSSQPIIDPTSHYSEEVTLLSKIKSINKRGGSTSSSRVQSAVGSVVTGDDIDISFLNENYMSLVDNEPGIQAHEINYRKTPITALKFLHEFLLLSVRVEQLKKDWNCRYLNVARVSDSKQYHAVKFAYQQTILEPALNLISHVLKVKGYSEDAIKEMSLDRKLGLLPEFDVRDAQLVVMLEALESHMIRETSNRIVKDFTLIKAEKLREDGSLPLDLWKTHAAKDTISLPKSDIVQHFANKLLQGADLDENGNFIIKKDTVEECLNNLGSTFMQHERLTFQTYSSFYENLLRHKEQIIQLKEREVRQSEQELALSQNMTDTSLQSVLGERVDELIVELTALRAKISEMREDQGNMEQGMREKLRLEYNALVHNMFSTCDSLRNRFEEYKLQITQECRDSIMHVRMSAIDKMRAVRRQSLHGTEDRLEQYASHAKSVAEIQEENSDLMKLLYKLRTISTWKKAGLRSYYTKKEGELRDKLTKSEKEKLELQLKHEQVLVNFRQDNEARKTGALTSEREIKSLQRKLEDEKRNTERRIGILNKEIESLRVEAKKPVNYDVVIGELAEKEDKLRLLETEHLYHSKQHYQEHNKSIKMIKRINYQLNKATSLKKEAFQRVEELQEQVNEYESVLSQTSHPLSNRPNTTMGTRSPHRPHSSLTNGILSRPKSTGLLVKRSMIHNGNM